MTPRTSTLAALVGCTTLLLAACTGQTEADLSPEEVLTAAKQNLDETSGVHVVLSTEKLPDGVSGIVSADGIGTHPKAFEGTIKAGDGGVTADVAVVAVDDVVYAQLPFRQDFVEIDPADYGAPDPAALMDTEDGLSSLLTAVEGVEEGDPVRDGELVLTEYTGTVPGEAVARIIPSASANSEFDATFTVTEDNLLNEAVLTGPFYPNAPQVSYTIEFDEYGTSKEITAP